MGVFETPETGKVLSSKEERLKTMGAANETPEDTIGLSNNETVRLLLRRENLTMWQLADAMGISEASITRLMRRELPDEKFGEIVTLIRSMRKSTTE